MKIYIVTTGVYSSYQIRGAFSTREKAQEYVDLCAKIPHYTSQFCADCGAKQEPPIDVLRSKVFKCLGCGKAEDLHRNAARNIKSMTYA